MKVCFLHARQDPIYALIMLKALHRAMPYAEVEQLTDETDTILPGVTGYKRLPWNGKGVMEFRLRHMAELVGEWLLLDTDVIVHHDLSRVFDWPFEVALTKRDGPILDPAGTDLTKSMPYNGGVVFSRNRDFWRECHAWVVQQSAHTQHWYGDQLALARFAPRYDVLTLHCDNFNYTPRSAQEDVSRRFAVHYKGERKPWMLLHDHN